MKLTYTKAQLIKEAKAIPLLNYPAELLTAQQLKERDHRIYELNQKYIIYEKEKCANCKKN